MSISRRLGWWLPFAISTTLTLPLAAYVGSAPGWLDSAWPVDAVLIGFVIPLSLFLLQAVGDGGLRAGRTFQVIIRRSAVVWPMMFSFWFVVATAVVERFGGKAAAPSWVTTWSLGLFVLQWVLLLVTFGRLLELLAPTGVAKALGRSLAVDIREGTLERLVREQAAARMDFAWREAGWTGPAGFAGSEVTIDERGYVDDLDIELPRRLKSIDQVTQLRTWFDPLGAHIQPGWTVAVLAASPQNPAVIELYRSAVFVRRKPRIRDDWRDVFRDVLDLVLRAVESGHDGDSELAIRIVVDGLMTVPDTSQRYGVGYTESNGVPWQRTYEDAMFEALTDLGTSAALSARNDALYRLVAMPYRIAVSSIEHDADPLFERALWLWLGQARDARSIGARQSANAVNERIHQLSAAVARQLPHTFRDVQLPLDKRIGAATRFARIDWFRAALLRRHLDAEDLTAFQALLEEEISWDALFNPQEAVRSIEQQLAATHDEAAKTALQADLSATASIANEFNNILELRGWQHFKVGAWTTWQYRRDHITEVTWRAMTNRLARPFSTGTIAQRLVAASGRDPTADRVLRELDDWDRDLVEIRPTFDSWTPQDGLIALWWGTLLLIREWSAGSPGQLPVESVHSYSDAVRANLDTLEREAKKWGWFVGPDIEAKIAAIRQALADTEETANAQARQRAKGGR